MTETTTEQMIEDLVEDGDDLEISYDAWYSAEGGHLNHGIWRATLRKGHKIIERLYTLSEGGELVVQRHLIVDGKVGGKNYDNYRFYSGNTVEYSLNPSLDHPPIKWIKRHNEISPEVELGEFYEGRLEEEIEE